MAQIPKSEREDVKMCLHHPGKVAIYVCLDCSDLACVTCPTKQHNCHNLTELESCIPEIKHNLTEYKKRVEECELPLITDTIESVEVVQKVDKDHVQRQVDDLRKQRDYIKKNVDDATERLVQMFYLKGSENTDIMSEHKQNLKKQRQKLQAQLKCIQHAFDTNTEALMYYLSKDIPSESPDIESPEKHKINFKPKEISLLELEPLFGEFEIGSSIEQYRRPASVYDKIDEPNKWQFCDKFTPRGSRNRFIKSLCPSPWHYQVWANLVPKNGKGCSKKIMLLDQKEERERDLKQEEMLHLQEELDLKVRVKDLCLSQKTGRTWICSENDKFIREISNEEPKVRFKTDREPESICVTADDNVVIGHMGQVVKYSQTGDIIEQTDVLYPYHISECPKTRRLAVVNLNYSRDVRSHDGKPCVSILDCNLAPVHTYNGDRGQRSAKETFHPRDVCYTSAGDLVITDRENKEVVLVNGNGEYKHTIYTVRELYPAAVCTSTDNSLWISFDDGSVHVLVNH